MAKTQVVHPGALEARHRFMERQKLLRMPAPTRLLAKKIGGLINQNEFDQLRELIKQYYPPDLADIMGYLDDVQTQILFELLEPAEAADTLDEVDDRTKVNLIRKTPLDRLAAIIATLPGDEAADILRSLSSEPEAAEIRRVLSKIKPQIADQIRFLLSFPTESAGGIMSLGFVAMPETATVGEAIEHFKQTPGIEAIFSIYIVAENSVLMGAADLHPLLSANPELPIREFMIPDVVSVPTDMDQEDVARIFARYDLNSLPVVNDSSTNCLVGVITADDIIDVFRQEFTQDLLRMAGSDAEEMERATPRHIAMLRLPWIMATMFIELLAGFVIRYFNPTLAKVLLLASFMPIISAISGNTGLQSATIIVRGLSTGTVRVNELTKAVLRQLSMTTILGSATGFTLGVIGAIWYGKWEFGLVIFFGMFIAVNIAGLVGTVVPLISKRLGFDPAITSGPFETAFQDVIGISIFLTLATIMLPVLLK